MLALLELEPRLVHARNADQATALMAAASHPDTQRSLGMMELLYGSGAHLGPRDSQQRHVLRYACTHDASVAVVETLLV
jgi:ankyrin repeat protein